MMRCPICDRWISQTTTSIPFCSDRCRRIDLGRWLNEDYGIPYERPEEDELEEGNASWKDFDTES